MKPAPLALVAALLLAGCVGATREDPASAGAASVADAAGARISKVADAGKEPTIGATKDGTLFVAGAYSTLPYPPGEFQDRLLRSTDGGATWVPAGDGVHDARFDPDPWMWVDPVTDRVYHAPNGLACSWLTWSDDEGKSWSVDPAGGCGLPGHDHQKLSTGPPARGVSTSGYPDVVYYAYNSLRPGPSSNPDLTNLTSLEDFEGSDVSVSLDGGVTFGLPVVAHPEDACHGGVNGAAAVAPDGTAYLPVPTCAGIDVVVSRDSGRSWEKPVPVETPARAGMFGADPSMATDAQGNAYLAWSGAEGPTWLSVSRDAGRTWSAPMRVSPPAVNVTTMAVMVAGAPGRVAIAYLGTDAAPWAGLDPSYAPDNATWHLYVSTTDDALSAAPAFSTLRATPADDPVHRGCIWLHGLTSDCNGFADFNGMTLREGRPVVVFGDDCDKCASAQQSRGLAAILVASLDAPLT